MSAPARFPDLRAGGRLSASAENVLRSELRALMRRSFNPAHFVVQGETVSLLRKRPVNLLDIGDMWELYQEDEDTPGLRLSMRTGLLVSTSGATLFPLHQLADLTPFTVTDDDDTEVWLRVSVEKTGYQAYFDVWSVSGYAVEHGAAVPADTLDLSTETAGDLHFHIGTVTAADGEITLITQQQGPFPVVVVFPLSVVLYEGICDPEEE
jgi:hypothetical protein